MASDRRGNATIAAAVVPPSRPPPRAARPSQQDTMAVAAVPVAARRGRPSQQDTVAMPAVPRDDDELALARTMMPRAKTEIATEAAPRGGSKKTMIATPVAQVRSNDSSLEIPIDAVLVDEELPRVRRQI